MRLNSRTGTEGPLVSSLNCDRPLHSGLKAPEIVMDAGCRDNRWTASLCTLPPGCSPLVLLPSQGVGSARASLSLVGCRSTSTGVFQEKPTVLAGHLKNIRTQCLSNNTRTHHCCQQWSRTHYSTPHTLWGCAGCGYNPGWCRSHPTVSEMT